MKFSSSMIKSFMSCPLQARFAMLDQLPEKGNAAAVFGSCVHISLEYFNLNDEDRDGALGLFSSLWHDPSNVGLQIDIWPKRTSWASYNARGLKMINDYADSMSWVSRVFVAAEHKFCVPFGAHMLSGIVDLLEIRNNKLYVIDFKSGRRPTYDQLYLDVQFSAYCWAVRQKEFWLGNESIDPKYTPVENGEVIWAQLEHMEIVPIWYDLGGNKELNVGHRGDTDFLRLYRCCLEIERAVEKEVFIPNISGSTCVFCPYTEHCHAYIPKSQSGKPIT